MADIVVDTNVWVMVDKPIGEVNTEEEKDCIIACADWLQQFIESEDRLVVDSFATYKVISEYRRNVKKGGVAESLLNQLTGRLFYRLVERQIEFDEDGYAILPVPITFDDPDDRKFIALAMTFNPYATIYNATDTDWAKEADRLAQQGFTLYELCPDYIQSRWTSP